jgi:hypothetical protein
MYILFVSKGSKRSMLASSILDAHHLIYMEGCKTVMVRISSLGLVLHKTKGWRICVHLAHTILMKFIQNCITETVECSETVRSSNLQLPSAHNRRIRKTEEVYLTSYPQTSSLASRLFLRSCRQYTLANVYLSDMWLSRCGDHTALPVLQWQQYCAVWLWDNTTAFTLVNQYCKQIINH